MALFAQYAIAAAEEAIKDAQIQQLSSRTRQNTGVVIGSGIGNLAEQHSQSLSFAQHGHHKMHPLYVPKTLINMASGHVAIRYGFMGPNLAPSTACTTGLHAIIEGARMIQNQPQSSVSKSSENGWNDNCDPIDVVIAGASEACVHPLAMSGFARARSLSTGFNDTPERASRPFDVKRDGFVIGEGAGVLVLEEREHALQRGATIYGELAGGGMSGDAFHMTAPRADGLGAKLAMQRALGEAVRANEAWGARVRQVDYVNAHATSTALGDAAENRAVREALVTRQGGKEILHGAQPSMVSMSSTKGATGHLLGAAGAVEAIFTLLAMRYGVLPPTINLEQPGDVQEEHGETENKLGAYERDLKGKEDVNHWDLDYIPNTPKQKDINVALTNSFGFGGTNASICFTRAF